MKRAIFLVYLHTLDAICRRLDAITAWANQEEGD